MSERDGYPAGVPCWVDNLVPDPERAMEFYGELFGWEAEAFGAPGLSLLRLPGFVGGEPQQPVPRDVVAVMAPPASETAPAVWAVGFWVTDADALADMVTGLGGGVVIAPFDSIPSRQALLSDPFGAPFSVSTAAH
ncbi:MAG: VOC family protein [Solirubrobacteraceae bacterium]